MGRPALALLLTAAVIGGCGGSDREPGAQSGAIVWSTPPVLRAPPGGQQARILQGVVRNRSPEPVELRADAVELRERDGDRVDGTAIFLSGYVRPGESQNRGPADLSRQEEERLGRVTRIRPGATAPLVVSWRTRSGEPAVVAYPGGTLKIPSG